MISVNDFTAFCATDAATEEVTVMEDPGIDGRLPVVDLRFFDIELGVVLLCLLDQVPLSLAFFATFLAFSSAFFLVASCLAFPQPSFGCFFLILFPLSAFLLFLLFSSRF